MKRFLWILTIAVMLTAGCAGRGVVKWGKLQVSLTNPTTTDAHWQADLRVENPTESAHTIQYKAGPQYTITVTRGGQEVYKQIFNPHPQPNVFTIQPGQAKTHLVIWRYEDQAGKKVGAGTYQVRAELQADSESAAGPVQVGPLDVEVK